MTEEAEQIRLIPGEDPDDLVERAKEEHAPLRTFGLFSGGGDSMVTAHRCRDHYDELVFIDTGNGGSGNRAGEAAPLPEGSLCESCDLRDGLQLGLVG